MPVFPCQSVVQDSVRGSRYTLCSVSQGVRGLILALSTCSPGFPPPPPPSRPAPSLPWHLTNPTQSLSNAPHPPLLGAYQKTGSELSSGPARPLRAGSAASWRKCCGCSQLRPGRIQAASFIKTSRTMVSLSSVLGGPHHWMERLELSFSPAGWRG